MCTGHHEYDCIRIDVEFVAGVKGKAMLPFYTWLHYEVIYLRWLVGVTLWIRKAQKNHLKEDSNR